MISSSFQHESYARRPRESVSSDPSKLPQAEYDGYIQILSGNMANLMQSVASNNCEAILASVSKLVNCFIAGVNLPLDLFSSSDFLSGCVTLIQSTDQRISPSVSCLLAKIIYNTKGILSMLPKEILTILDAQLQIMPSNSSILALACNLLAEDPDLPHFPFIQTFFNQLQQRQPTATDINILRNSSSRFNIDDQNQILLFGHILIFLLSTASSDPSLSSFSLWTFFDFFCARYLGAYNIFSKLQLLPKVISFLESDDPSVVEPTLAIIFQVISDEKDRASSSDSEIAGSNVGLIPLEKLVGFASCPVESLEFEAFECLMVFSSKSDSDSHTALVNLHLTDLVKSAIERDVPYRIRFQAVAALVQAFLKASNETINRIDLDSVLEIFARVLENKEDVSLSEMVIIALLMVKKRMQICGKISSIEAKLEQFKIPELVSEFTSCGIRDVENSAELFLADDPLMDSLGEYGSGNVHLVYSEDK